MRQFPQVDGQRGLATRAQLRAAGFTPAAIRHVVEVTGQRPFPGVYAAHRGPLDARTLLTAAALWAGPRTVLTGGHALALLGLPTPGVPTLARFLIAAGRHAGRAPGAEVCRTSRWPRTRLFGRLRTASVERALADAARYHDFPPAELEALTIAALQGQWTTHSRLSAELDGGRLNDTAPARAGLAEFAAGAWSVAESALRRVLRRRRWRVLLNPRIASPDGRFVGTPDAYLPDFGVAVQVHSRAYHAGSDADGSDLWQRTVERDARYAAMGVLVVALTPAGLRRDPARALALLDAAVAARGPMPPPPVVVTERERFRDDGRGSVTWSP